MDVSVDFKPRYRWLRSQKTPSLLGGGLLERVRSTTLALLGVTTAVGLAMVALALNQSWPLLADSPIPVGPPRHEAVGEATIAAQAVAVPGAGLVRLDGTAGSNPRRTGGGGDNGGAQAPESGFAPSASAELVVAPSAPLEADGDAPRAGGDPASPPSPAGKPPQGLATPVPVSAPAQPEPAPQAPPVVETTPPATSAEAPVNSSDDDWDDDSDDDDWDDDSDWDDDDDDWHGHGHGHGHRWSRGHHDD